MMQNITSRGGKIFRLCGRIKATTVKVKRKNIYFRILKVIIK